MGMTTFLAQVQQTHTFVLFQVLKFTLYHSTLIAEQFCIGVVLQKGINFWSKWDKTGYKQVKFASLWRLKMAKLPRYDCT